MPTARYRTIARGLAYPVVGAIPILCSEYLLLYRVVDWGQFHLSEFIAYLMLNTFLFGVFGLVSFVGWMTGLKGMLRGTRRSGRSPPGPGVVMWCLVPAISFLLLLIFGLFYFLGGATRPLQMLVYSLLTTGILFFAGLSLGLQVRGYRAGLVAAAGILVIGLGGMLCVAHCYYSPIRQYFYFIEITIVQLTALVLVVPLFILAFRLTRREKIKRNIPISIRARR